MTSSAMNATLLGAGEVGRVFLRTAGDRIVTVLRRGDDVASAAPDGPVVVAVREEDLGALVASLRPLAGRCVFVQNGAVDEVLAPLGDAATRGLVWFTAKGDFFAVLQPTVFHGPQAEAMAAWLSSGGVEARVEPDSRLFRAEVARKLAWNNVVGLPLAAHGVTLAEYMAKHAEEARAVIDETLRACGAAWGVAVDADAMVRDLDDTVRALGGARGGTKALAFRNGAVARMGRAHGVATPVNDALLARVGYAVSGVTTAG